MDPDPRGYCLVAGYVRQREWLLNMLSNTSASMGDLDTRMSTFSDSDTVLLNSHRGTHHLCWRYPPMNAMLLSILLPVLIYDVLYMVPRHAMNEANATLLMKKIAVQLSSR